MIPEKSVLKNPSPKYFKLIGTPNDEYLCPGTFGIYGFSGMI